MTTAAMVRVRARKEVRALAPAWLAGTAVMIASLLGDSWPLLAVVGYVTGGVALGALSVGHEYGNRTVTLLLSQPSRRGLLFVQKFVVLVAMMATFGAVGWVVLMSWDGLVGSLALSPGSQLLTFSLPLLCGLLLAPWLTMACRNALAGIVFSVAIPVGLWLFAVDVFWRAMFAVLACGALASWRTFMHLEAIDGRGFEVNLPTWNAADTDAAQGGAGRPGWLLIAKELRLQQLTFVVSGVYVAVWFGLTVFGERLLSEPEMADTLVEALRVLHAGAIPLLAGSLASAEERNLGTLGWQVLLPLATWKQWLVKSGAVIGLALGLTIGLPLLIAVLVGTNDVRMAVKPLLDSWVTPLMIVGVAVAGLYVSSISGNGLRAMLVALPLLIIAFGTVVNMVLRNTFRPYVITAPLQFPDQFETADVALAGVLAALLVVGVTGFLALLLAFGLANHRSADRGTNRIMRQVGWLTGSAVVWLFVWSAVFSTHWARLDANARESRERFDAQRPTVHFTFDGPSLSTAGEMVVVVFAPRQAGRAQGFLVVGANQTGEYTRTFLNARDGYSAVAVTAPQGTTARQFERQLMSAPKRQDSLFAIAKPLTLRAGETVTIPLRRSRCPSECAPELKLGPTSVQCRTWSGEPIRRVLVLID